MSPTDEPLGGTPVSRRQFLAVGLMAGTALLGSRSSFAPLSMLPSVVRRAGAQTQLPGTAIDQFVDPLPELNNSSGQGIAYTADTQLTVRMLEFRANMLPSTFRPASGGAYAGTWVWGYRLTDPGAERQASYIGPVIIGRRGTPTEIRWVNDLGEAESSQLRAWFEATDQTLHWADPLEEGANACAMAAREHAGAAPEKDCRAHYAGPIPACVHVHGAEVPAAIDGGPDAWFTSDGKHQGTGYYSRGESGKEAVYRYPNSQEAAPLWFHDHVLGITRLNVFAGLAGAFPLVDPTLSLPPGLHPLGLGAEQADGLPEVPIVPLVIQDRSFDVEGQLFFDNRGLTPEHPYWIPELVADTICVNGKVWPFKEVEPKRYRFLVINGSNARTYELFLADRATKALGPALYQIGTDGGYLDAPVRIDPNAPKGRLQRLTLMPGERADIIVDFAGLAPGTRLLLRNIAKTPFPGGATPSGSTVGRVMEFRVKAGTGHVDTTYNPATGAPLRPAGRRIVRLVDPATGTVASGVQPTIHRQLTLNEVMAMPMTVDGVAYPGGPLELLVNNTPWHAPVTEVAHEGATELWEIVNLTADAHPIHTHLTQFQLLNRQRFDVAKYSAAYAAAFPTGGYQPGFGPPRPYTTPNGDGALGGNLALAGFLRGQSLPPAPNEAGWKDTILAYPGQITRFVVRYAPTDTPLGATGAYPFEPNAGGYSYVWHCHIVDHEDNEMMRPTMVVPQADAQRTVTDY